MQKRRRSAKAGGAKKKAAARRAAPKARAKTARRGLAKPPMKKKAAKKAAPRTAAKKRTPLRGLPSTYTAPAPHEGEELEGGMDVGLQSDDEVGPDDRSTKDDETITED